jgi:hypothetical protein
MLLKDTLAAKKAEAAEANKAAKATPVEVTDAEPTPQQDPAWNGVRQTIAVIRSTGRAYLFAQAWAGWQLSVLKKEFGVKEGRRPKNSAKLAELRSWDEIVEAETGLPRRTADRFIELFEATKAKLKRTKKDAPVTKDALAIFQSENPLALPPEQREALQDVVSSLCDGETQASLLRELKIVPEPVMPAATKGTKEKPEPPEQLAFHFFDGPASHLFRMRAASDYKKFLHLLPATSDEQGKISLRILHDEAEAFLSDLRDALAAHAKAVGS